MNRRGRRRERSERKLSTSFSSSPWRYVARAVRGNENGKARRQAGKQASTPSRPRHGEPQEGSLRMQKCEVPYNRSSGRLEILNLGIPLVQLFSSSVSPLFSSLSRVFIILRFVSSSLLFFTFVPFVTCYRTSLALLLGFSPRFPSSFRDNESLFLSLSLR